MVWDYLVFVLFIVGSTIYPLWDDLRGRKESQTKASYVFATGRVSVFAIMLSIARGSLGVRAFIGYPSELYYRGSGMWETLYGLINAYPLVCLIFLPVYFGLDITSVYQYLDLRFKSRLVRSLASGAFVLRNVTAMGITLYTPCVALNTILGVPYYASLIAMTGISICFTLLGGLKAAITADVIQGITITLVSVLVICQGIYESGGISNVYNVNRDNDRLQFFKFTGDITTRVDTLSAYLGQLFISLSVLGCQQNLVQRYLSMKSEKEVRRTLFSNIPFITILFSLSWFVGMVVYSTYATCDPLDAGYTRKMDEILPFFVYDKLLYIPGCLGIFMATLSNGALCLNVSNINSLATVTWEDFLSQLPRFRGVIDKKQLHIIKYLGVAYAFVILGFAFCVGFLSGVIETAMLTSSATTGPLVGVFLLAVFVPVANWKGASAGMIISFAVTTFLSIGSFTIDKPATDMLPTSVDGCTNSTFSPWITKPHSSWLLQQSSPVEIGWANGEFSYTMSTVPPVIERNVLQSMFAITYMYYSSFGTVITLVIGTLISWILRTDEDVCDEKMLNPYFVRLMKFIRREKTSTAHVPSQEISTIEVEFNDHINYAFDNSAERGKEPTPNLAKPPNQFLILEPTEIYRKINDSE